MAGPTPAAAPAAESHGGSGSAIGKAIGIGFLVLILARGTMPAETQFALLAGVIAYFVFTRPAKH